MRYLIGGVSMSEEKMFELCIRYKRALEGLTPGGSEYVNDPERCAEYIRRRQETEHRLIMRARK